MLTSVEGYFIGWQPSRTGKLKYIQIQTADRLQHIEIGKTLRPLLTQVLKSKTFLTLQVKVGRHKLKAVSLSIVPQDAQLTTPATTKIQVCANHGTGKFL